MAEDNPYLWEGKSESERKAIFEAAAKWLDKAEADLGKKDPATQAPQLKIARPKGNAKQSAAQPEEETFTDSQLMQMDIPPERWVIQGILPEGLTVLAGKPKLGKSWLVLHLALAIGAAGVALGRISVERGIVLYLALEDTKRRLRKRILRLLGPEGQTTGMVHFKHQWDRMGRGGLEKLETWIKKHPGLRLLIIDTWAKFKPARLGKVDYEIDYQDGCEIKALADKYSISIIIIHHCRKLGANDALEEVSGSVGLTGAADGVIVLRRERGQADATLMVTGRDVDEQELALSFAKDHCLWQLLGDAQEYRLSKERAEIVRLLDQAGRPLKASEAAGLLDKPSNSVKQLMWKMANDGQIDALGSGLYALLRASDNRSNRDNSGNSDNRDNRPVTGGYPHDVDIDNRDDAMQTSWG